MNDNTENEYDKNIEEMLNTIDEHLGESEKYLFNKNQKIDDLLLTNKE